jgi:predicted nucleic acid-binding protein
MYAEVGNIIWKKQQLQGLAAVDAQQVLTEFQAITFLVTPSAHLLSDAYQLAITYQRTVYDLLYVALSIGVTQFVTIARLAQQGRFESRSA